MIRFLRTTVCGALLAASLPAMAIFTNGGFESGDFTGWTQGTGLNNLGGLTGAQPFTGASINLGAGGTFTGAVVGSGYTELATAPIRAGDRAHHADPFRRRTFRPRGRHHAELQHQPHFPAGRHHRG